MKRQSKYRVKKRAAVVYLLLAFMAGWLIGGACLPAAEEPFPPAKETLSMPAINSQAAVIADAKGQTLGALRAEDKRLPASLTKLLTAWTVLEHCPDVEQMVTVRAGTLIKLYGTGASTAGLAPDETLTVRELLAALLRPSGADAALVLAEYVSGSEKDFVRLMNEEAQALGMTHSHFANASGLDDDEQYSTAGDLMRLWQAVLSSETLKTVVAVEGQSNRWPSTLLSYDTPISWQDGQILGGKTGYTKKAGQCLASYAEVDGELYYLVTLGAPGEASGSGLHLADAHTLYSWAAAQRR